jgi:excinuclease ABC subunit B
MSIFKLNSTFRPSGDQPQAISKLIKGFDSNFKEQTLRGVTGSGKTFTMANLINYFNKPTLVISHNKTLAAQLYSEFKQFFPDNAVNYFVSYFDYYQPEAYIPRSDTYIEKDSQINEEIDRLRHLATDNLLNRKDVIIVASVSCIYGLGSVENYSNLSVKINLKENRQRDKLIRQLTDIQYTRNDIDFHRGVFRVRGDIIDIFPASEEKAYRIDLYDEVVNKIARINPFTGEVEANIEHLYVYPSSHFVTPKEKLSKAIELIELELEDRIKYFKKNNMLLEAQRLAQRTRFDIEMMQETGFVKGIENYSRYLTSREQGEQPATLLDYFPDDFLMLIDESHMTIPQVRGMYNGDRARKEVLVNYGFRLPSALDNRPLTFNEFKKHINKVVYISATPAEYELSRSQQIVEQIIRPTGLLDPEIKVYPTEGQIDKLIDIIRTNVANKQRTLITTLTKRMAEELTDYLDNLKIKVAYLHSDINTLERPEILNDLRVGIYDVLIGINLLREGLDLPEVSLVVIMDADREGFLRSDQALIQTIGRAARHQNGQVIMFADQITKSMKSAIDETQRRRKLQIKFNTQHNITPSSIIKGTNQANLRERVIDSSDQINLSKIDPIEYPALIKDLTAQMQLAAANLQFEEAADLKKLIERVNSNRKIVKK